MRFDGLKLVRRRSLCWLPLAAMVSGLLVGKLFAQCYVWIDGRNNVHQNVAGTLEHWHVPDVLCDIEMNSPFGCGHATKCTDTSVRLYGSTKIALCTGTAVGKWGVDQSAGTWDPNDHVDLDKKGPCLNPQ